MWLDEIVSCERNVTANGWYKKCDKTCCSNTSEIDIADARNSRMWNERGEKKKKEEWNERSTEVSSSFRIIGHRIDETMETPRSRIAR